MPVLGFFPFCTQPQPREQKPASYTRARAALREGNPVAQERPPLERAASTPSGRTRSACAQHSRAAPTSWPRRPKLS